MALADVMDAIASQLATELDGELDGLSIVPRLAWNATPPMIDVYPADPFLSQEAYGADAAVFTIRARTGQADNEAAQELLLELLDPSSALSVRAALRADPSFGGVVDSSGLEEGGPEASGFIEYVNGESRLLGCEWRLRVFLRDGPRPPAPAVASRSSVMPAMRPYT